MVLGWVMGSPQPVVLVVGSALGTSPDFGLVWIVPHGAWSMIRFVLFLVQSVDSW